MNYVPTIKGYLGLAATNIRMALKADQMGQLANRDQYLKFANLQLDAAIRMADLDLVLPGQAEFRDPGEN